MSGALLTTIAGAAQRREEGGVVFSPADFAGLGLWLDPSVSASMFDAETGGSASAPDGNVKRLEDQSGNGRHFTTSAAGTLRRVASLNGLDTFEVGSPLLNSASAVDLSGGATLFMVLDRISDNNGGVHAFEGANLRNHHPYAGAYYDAFASTTRHTWTQAYQAGPHSYVVVSDSGRWEAYIDGVLVYSTGTNTVAAQSAITQGLGLGGTPGPFGGKGLYGEAFCYEEAKSSGEIAIALAYLHPKWGISP